MPKIYLDYAATTPIDPQVLRAMSPYLKKEFGNPSSIHKFGQTALAAVNEARQKVANFLSCEATEVVFTGSATEANNLAIFGIAKKGDHVITSQIEHHAVLEPCHILEKKGVEVTYLPVDKGGLISVSDVKKAIKPNTILVSIIYANNEIGTVQPIAEIAKLLPAGIYFHTDAVQAANYLDCNVKKLGVSLLTLSSHKIYGPKGVGALYVKKGTPLRPLIYGGGHEFGMRSGTENAAGIVGLGTAIEAIQKDPLTSGSPQIRVKSIVIKKMRDKIINRVSKTIPGVRLNGSPGQRLPNNVNFSFKGAEGEAMVMALDQKGIAVSTGSACSSTSLEPSHVLLALGLSDLEAHGSLRITLGRYTTEKEIDKFLKVLPPIIARLRKISGYKNLTSSEP